MAAFEGHGEVEEALIKAGCNVDKANHDGVTPLYAAAQEGHGEVVEALIKGGCDTSCLSSMRDPRLRGLFVEHLEEHKRKMLALCWRAAPAAAH